MDRLQESQKRLLLIQTQDLKVSALLVRPAHPRNIRYPIILCVISLGPLYTIDELRCKYLAH